MNERDAKSEGDPGISGLWQAAVHPEPPAALDSRILAAARQAVAEPGAKPRGRGWWRLALPFSAAAVLVLAVTLLLRVEREAPQMLHDAAPPPLRQAPAAAEAETSAGMPSPSGTVREPPPSPESRRAMRPSAGPEAKMERGDAVGESAPASAPARPEGGGLAADSLEVPAARSAPALSVRPPAAPAASLEQGKAKAARAAEIGPEQAVERIRGLLRAGHRDEALQALAELRRSHPDFDLPPDLAALP